MASPSAAQPPGRLNAPGQVGTVDTVAGPGFCAGTARPDPASMKVGALAVDAIGTLWFESGEPKEGLLTKVVSTAATTIVRTGVASLGRRGSASPASSGHASASLMAPNQQGGLLLGLPTLVAEYADDFTVVAGAVAPAGTDPSMHQHGDGGPLREARFNQISAIASDAAGNVYVADDRDGDGSEIAIRFLNRSDRPVTFYGGTPWERTVAPGTLDTIAGGDRSPMGPVVAAAPELAVAGERLYLAGTAPGARAEVRMLNLGAAPLSTHGVTVAPGDMAAVVTVAVRDRAGGGATPAPGLGGIAADEQGHLFLVEPRNHRVRRVGPAGALTTFAGTGSPGFNGDDRPANEARLNRPFDVAVGQGGRVYVSDAGNTRVRVVDQAGTIRTGLGNSTTNRWLCEPAYAPSAAPGTAASLGRTGEPESVAADAAGNLYVAVAKMAQVHRLAPSGTLRLVAGGVCLDPAGCRVADDAIPSEANLGGLSILEPGSRGGVYVVQETRVRFLNPANAPVTVHGVAVPAGGMRTVVGQPPQGAASGSPSPPPPVSTALPIPTAPPSTTPDGAPAVAGAPGVTYIALATDRSGNLFLADVPQGPFFLGNGSVRHVDIRGIITTLIPRTGLRASGTVDSTRCCAYPGGLTTDTDGNLYVADTAGGRIWFLNRSDEEIVAHGVPVPPGRLEPVVGAGGEEGSQEEGIRALEARLSGPRGLVVDGVGNLYLADSVEHSVQRVDSAGSITTVAGNGQPGFNGDGLKGPLTALNQPTDVTIDGCGNLIVADSGNDRVRRLNMVASCSTASRPPAADGSARWSYATAGGGLLGSALLGTIVSRRRRRRERSVTAEAGPRGG